MQNKELLEAVIAARFEIQKIEGNLTRAKDVKNEAEGKLIEAMDAREIKSFKIEGLGNVSRRESLYVNVKKDDMPQLLQFVDEEAGRPDLIKRTIHPSSLRSFVMQRIKDGEGVPAFITQYYKPGLTITKA